MAANFDPDALLDALRSLGMLYGAQSATLAQLARDGGDEAQAIRAYILKERPHLLASYDLETLVWLVRGAIERRAGHGAALEQFGPS